MTSSSSLTPLVEVVIAVHDASRPIDRAILSLLESGLEPGSQLAITVVCHNVSAGAIREAVSEPARAATRFLELADGIRSPAGPFTLGIAEARADYVSIMGSDDYLEPGALTAWLAFAEANDLVCVIAPERHAAGGRVRTPAVRPMRRLALDGVRDRLSYRTAPLGLIRREAIGRLGLEFPSGLATGEDHLFSLMLWFSGERIGYARGAPNYVVGADAADRASTSLRGLSEELRAMYDVLASRWLRGQPEPARTSIVVKFVRVHVFGMVATRLDLGSFTDDDRRVAIDFLDRCAEVAPRFRRVLSLADVRLLDALAHGEEATGRLRELARARRRFGHPSTLLVARAADLLAVDAPLRFAVASALI